MSIKSYDPSTEWVGIDTGINMKESDLNTIGEIAKGINITGSSSYGRIKYSLENCYSINRSSNYINLSSNPMEKLTIDVSIEEVHRIIYQSSE